MGGRLCLDACLLLPRCRLLTHASALPASCERMRAIMAVPAYDGSMGDAAVLDVSMG